MKQLSPELVQGLIHEIWDAVGIMIVIVMVVGLFIGNVALICQFISKRIKMNKLDKGA
jgi:uncharacterized protein YneF (UPF0154 family)